MTRHPGLRLLPERFMVIRQALGVPAGRDPKVAGMIDVFLAQVRAEKFIDRIIAENRVEGATVVVDDSVANARNLVAGANKDGFHVRNSNVGRDYEADIVADISAAAAGHLCPHCGNPMITRRAIEIGNIFKLGTRYTEAMGATYLDKNGKSQPIVMGSYGIGVGRGAAGVPGRGDAGPGSEDVDARAEVAEARAGVPVRRRADGVGAARPGR